MSLETPIKTKKRMDYKYFLLGQNCPYGLTKVDLFTPHGQSGIFHLCACLSPYDVVPS